ncbi:LysM domain-containing protein [Pseudomonas sp. H22_DOA]|nr:LysM domain-containing protein [Pseudomonas sp. H22_DOA]
MSNTYTVKSGDTLGSIAAANKCSVADLRALNPIITDPNHIKTGWALNLPATSAKAMPPPKHADNQSTTAVKGAVECKDELVEVIHITGEEHFYILTEKESNALKKQSDLVKKLMDELHQNLASATEAAKCTKTKDPQASCSCTSCVKDKWNAKAEEAGLLQRSLQLWQNRKPSSSARKICRANWQPCNRLVTGIAVTHPSQPLKATIWKPTGKACETKKSPS